MNLAYPAIICLILGSTSGIHGKNIFADEDLSKESRKLLYVVGVYPEWEEKIAEFKKKWGKRGEKYMNQPNVYVHGDVPLSEETKRRMDTDSLKINITPLLQVDAPESRRNNTKPEDGDLNVRLYNYVKKLRRNHSNSGMKSEPIGLNATDTKRNDKEPPVTNETAKRRALEYQNFVKDILKPEEPIRKIYVSDKAEKKSSSLENKDETIQRKYGNIDKIYRANWLRNMNDSPKEEIKNNEEDTGRRYNNVDRMYGKLFARKLDLSNEIESKIPNYWVRTLDEGLEDVTNKNKPYGRVYVQPNKHQLSTYLTEPELELKWIKEVFIPRLLDQKSRKTASTSEETQTEPPLKNDHSNESIVRKSLPQIKINGIELKQKEKGRRNFKLKSGEEFLKERKLGRIEAGFSNIKQDDDEGNNSSA